MKKIIFVFSLFFVFLLLVSCDKEAGSTTTITSVDSSTTASMTTTTSEVKNDKDLLAYYKKHYYNKKYATHNEYIVFEDGMIKIHHYSKDSTYDELQSEVQLIIINEHHYYFGNNVHIYYIDEELTYKVNHDDYRRIYVYDKDL